VARHFLATFEACEYIVAPSGSCTSMVAHHFSELFQKEPETLARVHSLDEANLGVLGRFSPRSRAWKT